MTGLKPSLLKQNKMSIANNTNREIKNGRLKDQLHDLASKFLSKESNRTSLITVTDLALSKDNKRANIFITVLPEEKEEEALEFAKRMRSEFREFAMKNSKIARLPFFDFLIDKGEKNRQLIDEISQKAKN